MKTRLLILVSGIILLITLSVFAKSVKENRLELESEIRTLLADNYLHKSTFLVNDKSPWLDIELKPNTWRNPKDTRALVDSVMVSVKRHLSLTSSYEPFVIFIGEIVSALTVANITVSGNDVSLKYSYTENQATGKDKVYRKSEHEDQSQFVPAGGKLYSGVKLYYGMGKQKRYIGEIVCFNFSLKLVKIRYPSSNEEYKQRRAIINPYDHWYVDKNDPALKAGEGYECY